MNDQIDLEKIERKAYLAYHDDGVWDWVLGLSLLMMGFGVNTPGDNVLYNIVPLIPMLGFFIVPAIRKSITLPRLGYAKFSPQRQARQKRNSFGFSILLTIVLILGVVVSLAWSGEAAWQQWVRSLELLPMGLVMALMSGAVAALYGIRRGFLYAAVIVAVFTAGYVYHLRAGTMFIMLGLVLTLMGSVMFVRFLIRNPRPKMADPSGL